MLTGLLLKVVKAELLCYGLRLDNTASIEILNKNPYALEHTLVHAMHIVINGVVINVCIAEEFCKSSPYYLTYENNFILWKNFEKICFVDVIEIPYWCKEKVYEYRIGDYIRPHSHDCISCSPIIKCGYYKIGKACKFCSLNDFSPQGQLEEKLDPKVLAHMIYKAMSYKYYELNFSAGTVLTEDKSANYYITVLKELKKKSLKRFPHVSVEITPPDKDCYIQDLVDCGVTALIMNIEIAEEKLRKEICPGKSEVSIERYFDAMQKAVSILGRGNVSSVLLAGIQPVKDIISMGKELLAMGVIPTIMPFKPLDDCDMKKNRITNPEELIFINDILEKEIIKVGLNPCFQHGCTRCGGCSLESITFMKN